MLAPMLLHTYLAPAINPKPTVAKTPPKSQLTVDLQTLQLLLQL